MRVAPDAELTDSLARDLGRRTGAKAFVTGALRPLGAGYALTAPGESADDAKPDDAAPAVDVKTDDDAAPADDAKPDDESAGEGAPADAQEQEGTDA